jgi:hypothetical protein
LKKGRRDADEVLLRECFKNGSDVTTEHESKNASLRSKSRVEN